MSDVVHDESVIRALVHTGDLDELVAQVTARSARVDAIQFRWAALSPN